MPKVTTKSGKTKKFPYSKEGKKKAKAYAKANKGKLKYSEGY